MSVREIVQTLAGDLQAGRVGDALSPRRARQLWQVLPHVAEALVEEGPGLIDRLVSRQAVDSQAEACFERAIALAREQSAKLWELRAVEELAQLWMAQGKLEKARVRLSEIYDRFTEGFDGPGLLG